MGFALTIPEGAHQMAHTFIVWSVHTKSQTCYLCRNPTGKVGNPELWGVSRLFGAGAMKLESPSIILETVKASWWDLVKAGWRVWPIVHLVTYTVIPCRDR